MSERFQEASNLFVDDDDVAGDGLVIDGSSPEPAAPVAPRCAVAANNNGTWGLRQGREVLDENQRQLEAAAAGEKVIDLTKMNLGEDLEATVSDFFGSVFQYEISTEETCQDPKRLQYLQELASSPEFASLRVNTIHSVDLSRLATASLLREYHTYREKEEKEDDKSPGKQPGGNKPGDQPGDAPGDDAARCMSAQRALREAKKEVGEAVEAGEAFGIDASSPKKEDLSTAREIYKRVRKNPELQKIIEMAGRFRFAARSLQRQKTVHGTDEMVGITMGKSIPRLLTMEKARLVDDDEGVSLEALDRLLKGQCLMRQLQGTEPQKSGPVFVLLDESSSMTCNLRRHQPGSLRRIDMAKALLLAMCHVAESQNRWVCLVAFSCRHRRRILTLSPGSWNRLALLDWLEQFIDGSTYAPLDDMPRLWEQTGAIEGRTDILCLTDGDADGCEPEQVEPFLEWKKKAKARFVLLGIGTDGLALRQVADETHVIKDFAVGEEGIQQALSF